MESEWIDNVNVLVNPEGRVFYIIRSDFKVTCNFDLTYFPADIQSCPLVVALQTYWAERVNLTHPQDYNQVDITRYDPNGEWDLINSSIERQEYSMSQTACCFSAIRVTITYRRLVS